MTQDVTGTGDALRKLASQIDWEAVATLNAGQGASLGRIAKKLRLVAGMVDLEAQDRDQTEQLRQLENQAREVLLDAADFRAEKWPACYDELADLLGVTLR